MALPRAQEERAPSFQHHAASELPQIDGDGTRLRLIAGTLYGERAPVATLSDMFYADVALAANARLPVATDYEQRAIYVVRGGIDIDGGSFNAGELLVLRPGRPVTVHAQAPAQLLLLGGAPLDGPRHVWWNFVSSSTERIQQAKIDWRDGRLGSVPGDCEFIPLPPSAVLQPGPVDYP